MSPERAMVVISVACSLTAASVAARPESASSAGAVVPVGAASAPQQVGSGSARAGGLSNSTKWLIVGAVSFSLALGTLGFSLRPTSRKQKPLGMQARRPLLSKLSERHAPVRDPSAGARRICPACGLQYRENVRFCGRDGSALLLVTPNH